MVEKVFTNDWTSHNYDDWDRLLDKRTPIHFLEIGSYQGRSTLWFLQNLNIKSMTCVDTFEGGAEHTDDDVQDMQEIFHNNVQEYSDKIAVHATDSYDFLKNNHMTFDFIYIDGSHLGKHVITDAVLAFHTLSQGGQILFDDYNWHSDFPEYKKPKEAIDCFLSLFRDEINVNAITDNQVLITKK